MAPGERRVFIWWLQQKLVWSGGVTDVAMGTGPHWWVQGCVGLVCPPHPALWAGRPELR